LGWFGEVESFVQLPRETALLGDIRAYDVHTGRKIWTFHAGMAWLLRLIE